VYRIREQKEGSEKLGRAKYPEERRERGNGNNLPR
jgi:hypothetical protein